MISGPGNLIFGHQVFADVEHHHAPESLLRSLISPEITGNTTQVDPHIVFL